MSVSDLQTMPRFTWVEPPRAQLTAVVWRGSLQLLLPSLLLAALAAWWLRRYRVL